jgi:hypothetical protein
MAELTIFHGGANRGFGLDAIGGNNDALSGSEPVGFDHEGQTELTARDHLVRGGGGVADAEAGGGHAVSRHERFGE